MFQGNDKTLRLVSRRRKRSARIHRHSRSNSSSSSKTTTTTTTATTTSISPRISIFNTNILYRYSVCFLLSLLAGVLPMRSTCSFLYASKQNDGRLRYTSFRRVQKAATTTETTSSFRRTATTRQTSSPNLIDNYLGRSSVTTLKLQRSNDFSPFFQPVCQQQRRYQMGYHPIKHFATSSSSSESSSEQFDNLLNGVDQLLDGLSEEKTIANANNNENNDKDENNDDDHPLQKEQQKPTNTNDGWRFLSHTELPRKGTDLEDETKTTKQQSSSPIDEREIFGRKVYIKRDDLLRLSGSQISGNKARKMYGLNEIPHEDFPTCIVSYGGPQSNAMLALAAIVQYKNRQILLGNDDDVETSTMTMDDNLTFDDTDMFDFDIDEEENDSIDDDDDDEDDNDPPDNNVDSNEKTDKEMDDTDKRKLRFVYVTKKLPRFLRNQPSGNLFRALSLGMELIELSQQQYNDLFGGDSGGDANPPAGLNPPITNDSVWIPQGGAFEMAVPGAKRLANEIFDYWQQHGNGQPLSVCLPGGTCSTALLLHHELKHLQETAHNKKDGTKTGADKDEKQKQKQDSDHDDYDDDHHDMDIKVVVIPCVGSAAYAKRQMMSLSGQIGKKVDDVPIILSPTPQVASFSSATASGSTGTTKNIPGQGSQQNPSSSASQNRYFNFGKPNKEILKTYHLMQDRFDIVLDLLYGAPAWNILLRHWKVTKSVDGVAFDPYNPLAGRQIMYVHSGGLEGINSQLLRYKYDGLLRVKDIQLPGKTGKKKQQKQKKNISSSVKKEE